MKTALAKIVADIHRRKLTGLLSITVKETSQLFKIYFKDGEIYHIAYMQARNAECLDLIDNLDLCACGFLPKIRLSFSPQAKQNRAPIELPSTAEIIRYFEMTIKTLESNYFEGAEPPAREEGNNNAGVLSAERAKHIQDGLMEALIRQIGPVGKRLATLVIDKKWQPAAAAAPTRQDLIKLADLLSEEIDDPEYRTEFIEEAQNLLP